MEFSWPVVLGQAEIMINKLVHQPADNVAVFTIDCDREANFFFRENDDRGFETEHGATMPNYPCAPIFHNIPPEAVV